MITVRITSQIFTVTMALSNGQDYNGLVKYSWSQWDSKTVNIQWLSQMVMVTIG